jgi:hypothetical protein
MERKRDIDGRGRFERGGIVRCPGKWESRAVARGREANGWRKNGKEDWMEMMER